MEVLYICLDFLIREVLALGEKPPKWQSMGERIIQETLLAFAGSSSFFYVHKICRYIFLNLKKALNVGAVHLRSTKDCFSHTRCDCRLSSYFTVVIT